MELGERVPISPAIDVRKHAAAEKGSKVDRLAIRLGVQAAKRLEPDQRELDGMFPLMRGAQEMLRRFRICRERINQVIRTDRTPQWGEIIAPVEIPFEAGPMADAENDVTIGKRFFQKRLECSGIGLKSDAEIDVRRNYTCKGTPWRCRRQFIRRQAYESIAEEGERCLWIGWITNRMLLGSEGTHGMLFTYGFGENLQAFSQSWQARGRTEKLAAASFSMSSNRFAKRRVTVTSASKWP